MRRLDVDDGMRQLRSLSGAMTTTNLLVAMLTVINLLIFFWALIRRPYNAFDSVLLRFL